MRASNRAESADGAALYLCSSSHGKAKRAPLSAFTCPRFPSAAQCGGAVVILPLRYSRKMLRIPPLFQHSAANGLTNVLATRTPWLSLRRPPSKHAPGAYVLPVRLLSFTSDCAGTLL